ncbi:hypothetical protein F5Y17DRAFT_336946 [Xylariaceae sp. FL0594]|nr:hypothetical protein F5Y17DRAFT_336946 [Xylariaceae sp. FL0594]
MKVKYAYSEAGQSQSNTYFSSDLSPTDAPWFTPDTASLGHKPHAHRLMIQVMMRLTLLVHKDSRNAGLLLNATALLQVQILSSGWLHVTAVNDSTMPPAANGGSQQHGFEPQVIDGADPELAEEGKRLGQEIWTCTMGQVEEAIHNMTWHPFVPLGAVFMYIGLDTDGQGNLYSKISFASVSSASLLKEKTTRHVKVNVPSLVDQTTQAPPAQILCVPGALDQLPPGAQNWLNDPTNIQKYYGTLLYDKAIAQQFLFGRFWNPVGVLESMKPDLAWPRSFEIWVDVQDGSIAKISVMYGEGDIQTDGVVDQMTLDVHAPEKFKKFGLYMGFMEWVTEMTVGTYGPSYYVRLKTNHGREMEAFKEDIQPDRFVKTVFQPPEGFPYLKTWYAWVSGIRVDGVGPCWGAAEVAVQPFYSTGVYGSMSPKAMAYFDQKSLWKAFPKIRLTEARGNIEDLPGGDIFFDAIAMEKNTVFGVWMSKIELFFSDYRLNHDDPSKSQHTETGFTHVLVGIAITINGLRLVHGKTEGTPVATLMLDADEKVVKLRLERRLQAAWAITGIQMWTSTNRELRYAGAPPLERPDDFMDATFGPPEGCTGLKGFWGYAQPGHVVRLGAFWA